MSQPDRIILVGLSGAGKSTLTRRVATRIGWAAVDVDAGIVAEAGMDVSTIFEEQGEQAFRRLERDVLLASLKARRSIIATGGGAMVRSDNRRDILAAGLTIYVKSSPKKCAYYLRRSYSKVRRPLLDGDGDMEILLSKQLATRYRFYEAAHLTLDAANKDIEDLVDELELISHRPIQLDRKQ